MVSKVCENQRCKKEYFVPEDKLKEDDGFCSFICWSHANCNTKVDDPTETLILDLKSL